VLNKLVVRIEVSRVVQYDQGVKESDCRDQQYLREACHH
jgi:hypothetical protein